MLFSRSSNAQQLCPCQPLATIEVQVLKLREEERVFRGTRGGAPTSTPRLVAPGV